MVFTFAHCLFGYINMYWSVKVGVQRRHIPLIKVLPYTFDSIKEAASTQCQMIMCLWKQWYNVTPVMYDISRDGVERENYTPQNV